MPLTFLAHALRVLFVLVAAMLCATVIAQTEAKISVDEAQETLEGFEATLRYGLPSAETEEAIRKEVATHRRLAQECIELQDSKVAEITRDIKTLGPEKRIQGTAPVSAARTTLEQERADFQERLAGCKLLLVNADAVLSELDRLHEQALTRRLTARSLNVFSLLVGGETPVDWATALSTLELEHSGAVYLDAWRLFLLLALTAGLFVVGLYVRLRLRALLATPSSTEDRSGEALVAFTSAAARYMPLLLASLAWSAFWVAVVEDWESWPQLAIAGFAVAAYATLALCGRALFSVPYPARHYLPIDVTQSQRFWKALHVLVLVAAIGAALFFSPFVEGLSEPLLVLVRAVYEPLFIFSLIRVVWLAFSLQSKRGVGVLRPIVTIALLAALIAELGGYHNLTDFVVRGIALTLIGLGLAWLLTGLLTDLFDGVDEGRYAWQQRLRTRLGLEADQHVPGVVWLRVTTTLVVWGMLFLFLLRIWGLSEGGQEVLLRYLTEGFVIGPVTLVPIQLIAAAVLFTLLLSGVAWFKKQLDERWLRKSRLEPGARDATVTLSGYMGAALAGLIALTVAGVDFKNLAIIAGALSVGIGFGLQNIVSNFVSGLILLFERPIRVGDWVVVGSTQTEGYVKRISIRSTQILTFDLADVIVPNSQLIAEQVTNWMLRDVRGRVIVPFGVAYGSDTSLVKKIVLEVAQAHSAPIKDGSLPEPKVFFLRFGDISLEFELRFFIRHVDERINVISDMNFAIEAAFHEAGIDMPHRDIHLRPPGAPPPEPQPETEEASEEEKQARPLALPSRLASNPREK
jgi:small-conductance mechanosensitive channel